MGRRVFIDGFLPIYIINIHLSAFKIKNNKAYVTIHINNYTIGRDAIVALQEPLYADGCGAHANWPNCLLPFAVGNVHQLSYDQSIIVVDLHVRGAWCSTSTLGTCYAHVDELGNAPVYPLLGAHGRNVLDNISCL